MLEIFFVIRAWKCGWGPLALIPLFGAMAFGAAIGAAGAPFGVGLIGDAVAITILVLMAKNPRHQQQHDVVRGAVKVPRQTM